MGAGLGFPVGASAPLLLTPPTSDTEAVYIVGDWRELYFWVGGWMGLGEIGRGLRSF